MVLGTDIGSEWGRRRIMFFFMIVLVLTLITAFLLIFYGGQAPVASVIVEKPGGIREIDVISASDNQAFVDSQGLQIRTGDISTVFSTYGFYKGMMFKKTAYEEGIVKMRITSEMNPYDGIIEGFVVFELEDNKPTYKFYVDNDWKNSIENTNIWWGFAQENKKKFVFNEISDGIYTDQITDETENYVDDYKGSLARVFIGDMTEKKIQNNENMTFVVIE